MIALDAAYQLIANPATTETSAPQTYRDLIALDAAYKLIANPARTYTAGSIAEYIFHPTTSLSKSDGFITG